MVNKIPARIRWAVDFMDVQPNDHVLEIGRDSSRGIKNSVNNVQRTLIEGAILAVLVGAWRFRYGLADRLHEINPHVNVHLHPVRLTSANALEIFAQRNGIANAAREPIAIAQTSRITPDALALPRLVTTTPKVIQSFT